MNIRCPYCNFQLAQIRLEKGKSSLECSHCRKEISTKELVAHNIAAFSQLQMLADQLPHNLQELARMAKSPPGRKIAVATPEPNKIQITLRGPNWLYGCSFLLFALFWNGAMVAPFTKLFMSGAIHIWWGKLLLVAILVLVWPVGMLTLASVLFYVYGHAEITIDPTRCRLRKTVFRIGYAREIATADISEVTFNGPAVSIRTESKSLEFASGLSCLENTWLILLIQSFLQLSGHE